jgi:hypothetical protein
MTTRRARTGNLLAMRAETGKQVDRILASRFPVQHEIQHLQNELNAFNDRIIERKMKAIAPRDGSVEGKGDRLCTADR